MNFAVNESVMQVTQGSPKPRHGGANRAAQQPPDLDLQFRRTHHSGRVVSGSVDWSEARSAPDSNSVEAGVRLFPRSRRNADVVLLDSELFQMMVDVFVAERSPGPARELSERWMKGKLPVRPGREFVHHFSKGFALAIPVIRFPEKQFRCGRGIFWKWRAVDDDLFDGSESDWEFFVRDFEVTHRHS